MEYLYAPIDASTEIRLLRLSPSWEGEALQGEIVRCSLEQADPFCALSYAWGPDDKPFQLSTPDGIIRITQTLRDALYRIRDPDHHLLIWADAICIDQNDIAEKGIQVSIMKDIYKKSSETVIELGESSVTIDLVFEAIQMIFSQSQPDVPEPECEIRRSRNIPHRGVPELLLWYQRSDEFVMTQEFESGITELCTKNYFRRRWIVQEVVVSESHPIYVQCGSTCIEWTTLAHGLAIVFSTYQPHSAYEVRNRYDEVAPDIRQRKQDFLRSFAPLQMTERMQREYRRGERSHICELLRRLQSTRCERRHDLILSLIGITTSQDTIQLDWSTVYQSSVDDLCWAVSKSLIEAGELNELLQLCKYFVNKPWRLSWVLNIDDDFVQFAYFQNRYTHEAYLKRNSSMDDWRVCVQDDRFLQMNVTVFDTVKTTLHWPNDSDTDTLTRGVAAYIIAEMHALFKDAIMPNDPTPSSGEALSQLCAIVLVAGWCWDNVWAPSREEAMEEIWHGFLSYYLTFSEIYLLKHGHDMTEIANSKESELDLKRLNEALQYLANLSKVNNMGFGAICLTDRNFAANLPYTTTEGDLLAIIPGVGVPVVLGESEEYPGKYRYLGPAYVVGLMKGEALTLENIEQREILIH